MSEVEALQARIMAALDRIGSGLDGVQHSGGGGDGSDDSKIAELRQALEDEQLANGQLEERVKALSARVKDAEGANASAASERETSEAGRKEALRKMDAELQALRLANQQLRDNNAALREANTTGVVEPHLINKAMMAELEGLRASRSADRAEMDLILADLETLIDGDDASDTALKEDA